jgi:hypothetical protein
MRSAEHQRIATSEHTVLRMKVEFTFSDTIAGYVSSYNSSESCFTLHTSDDREFTVYLNPNTYARYAYNLAESYQDATGGMPALLALPRQFVYAYGSFYPAGDTGRFEAQWPLPTLLTSQNRGRRSPAACPRCPRGRLADVQLDKILDSGLHPGIGCVVRTRSCSIDTDGYDRTCVAMIEGGSPERGKRLWRSSPRKRRVAEQSQPWSLQPVWQSGGTPAVSFLRDRHRD